MTSRDRAIVYLAMWTGARSSSIAEAKLSGVSLKSRSGTITCDTAKGKASGYTVPLNAEARETLAAWTRQRPPVQHDHLFTAEKYPFDPISRWTLHDVWHRRLARHVPEELRARLKGLHQCRHGLGRLLVERGVPLPDVMQVLNHQSLSSVAVYTKPSERDLRNHLERAVGEEPEE